MPEQPGPATRLPPTLSERLQAVTEALAAATTPPAVVEAVLQPALEALGAVAGAVLLVSGDRLEISRTQGHEGEAAVLWPAGQGGPLDGSVPAGHALKSREALFFEHAGELKRAFPDLEARLGAVAARASAVLPMVLDERPLGALVLDFQEPHAFTPEERRFLRTLAGQCALALDRAGLLARLQQAERHSSDILESIDDAFYAVDQDWRLTYVNRRAEQLWGRRREDLLGQVYWEVFPQAVGSEAQRAHLRAAAERRAVRIETLSPILGVWLDLCISPSETGLAVYFRDISGRRQAEAQVQALNRSLEQRVQERTCELDEARRTAEVLAALGDALQRATFPEDVAALALAPLGGALGAHSAMVVQIEDGILRVPTVWGEAEASMEALRTQNKPLEQTGLLRQLARSGEPGYYPDYQAARGSLAGLPPLAFAAEPIRLHTQVPGQPVAGFLCVWRGPREEAWPERDRELLRRAAGTLALALERAGAAAQLDARARLIGEQAQAHAAFVAFTEAVGTQTDVLVLARQAIEVVQGHFQQGSVVYYTREGDLWRAQAWSDDLTDELLSVLRAGLPDSTPIFRQALETGEPVFTDAWDARQEGVSHAGAYHTVAAYPLSVNGEARHLLTFGLKDARQWSERDRALVRAVGRGLNLVLDRTAQARQLEEERAALEAFTAFAEAAGTTTDVPTLTGRAIEVLRARFSDTSTAVSYERDGDLWKARLWSEDLEDQPELLRVLRAGLPLDTPLYAEAARTGQPVFTERWDAEREHVAHSEVYGAAANYPLVVGGEVRGFLALGLRHTREWSERDKALLRAVGRSLSLALERAEVTGQLLAQRQSLEAANEELEAFAYSVSHDLRTPVRHVMSFNGLLRTQLGDGLDAKAARYLTIVDEAAGRMNTLIDAMLNLSRTSRLPLRLGPVDLGELVGSVRTELEPDVLDREVEWRVAPLPLVHGDHDTLRQVVTNLLDNALKYTRTRDVACIEVWAEERPQEWIILVRDNGVGFDPRYGNKLFGVFQRLHRAEEFEGTGVGLANVRRIITRHGGRVSSESQPGEGATFRFTLPRH